MAAKNAFQPGTLLGVATDERLYNGTSSRRAIFTVKIADLVYTARGERVRSGSGDYGRGLIVGDPVQAAVNGEILTLLRPGGKEMKVKIIKRERVQ